LSHKEGGIFSGTNKISNFQSRESLRGGFTHECFGELHGLRHRGKNREITVHPCTFGGRVRHAFAPNGTTAMEETNYLMSNFLLFVDSLPNLSLLSAALRAKHVLTAP
jgi:hypothetical protein